MPRKNLKGYILAETIVGWTLCCCVSTVSDFSVFCVTSFGERNICNTKTSINLSLPKHAILKKRNTMFCFVFKKSWELFLWNSRIVTTRTSMINNWLGKNYVSGHSIRLTLNLAPDLTYKKNAKNFKKATSLFWQEISLINLSFCHSNIKKIWYCLLT